MGGKPWSYFVTFQASIEDALEDLRQHVFDTGEYRGSDLNPATPEAALENSGEEGTASILDMLQISDFPDFCCVTPLDDDRLMELFGTMQPTHEMVESSLEVSDGIDRGHGICLVVYKNGKPSEYYFAGYSFD